MGRRTVLLVAAIVIAAVGAGLVLLYVHNVNQRASAREAPRQVLVAKKIIPAGTTGAAAFAAGDVEATPLPEAAIAPNALASISKVADLVALSPIFQGEQILSTKFGKEGDSGALTIPTAGTIAISLSLPGPARVNGFIVPGSEVAVYLTSTGTTRLILNQVKVIAVGSRTLVPSSGQATATGQQSDVVTFGVTAAQAQKLIFAQSTGSLYLALLTPNSSTPSEPPTTAANILSS